VVVHGQAQRFADDDAAGFTLCSSAGPPYAWECQYFFSSAGRPCLCEHACTNGRVCEKRPQQRTRQGVWPTADRADGAVGQNNRLGGESPATHLEKGRCDDVLYADEAGIGGV